MQLSKEQKATQGHRQKDQARKKEEKEKAEMKMERETRKNKETNEIQEDIAADLETITRGRSAKLSWIGEP
jgi:hypothetical protein